VHRSLLGTRLSAFGSRRREPETKSADLFASSSPDDESCTRTALPVPRYGDQGRGRLLTNTFSHRRHHRPRHSVTDSHFARESTLVQASDLAGCCESHCDNHDASHTRGALRSSIVALATLSNQRFACLRSLGMALKPLAYESPRLKHAH